MTRRILTQAPAVVLFAYLMCFLNISWLNPEVPGFVIDFQATDWGWVPKFCGMTGVLLLLLLVLAATLVTPLYKWCVSVIGSVVGLVWVMFHLLWFSGTISPDVGSGDSVVYAGPVETYVPGSGLWLLVMSISIFALFLALSLIPPVNDKALLPGIPQTIGAPPQDADVWQPVYDYNVPVGGQNVPSSTVGENNQGEVPNVRGQQEQYWQRPG